VDQGPRAERLATLDAYMTDPRCGAGVAGAPPLAAWEARPNAGHRALVELERDGRLTCSSPRNRRLHSWRETTLTAWSRSTAPCATSCACLRARTAAPAVIERVRAGEKDPHCETTFEGANCGGILKSATISFGQQLSVIDLARAQLAVEDADVLLCVGTSLGVYPAAVSSHWRWLRGQSRDRQCRGDAVRRRGSSRGARRAERTTPRLVEP